MRDSTLFKFKVKLQTLDENNKRKQVTVDLLPDLSIEMEILEEQMMDLPAQYIFWSTIYSEARLAVSVAERSLKIRRGRVNEKIQETARAENIKLSVDQVKNIVEADKELAEADIRLQNAQMICGKLYHMVEAIKMKSELARSLAGFKRLEKERS